MANWDIPSLQQYVRRRQDKDKPELDRAAFEWMKASARNRLDYETEWLGVPIIQTPEDIVLMQELIFRVRPDVIVETGVAHGGSLVFYASLFELLGKGRVIGVDVEIRPHNRKVIEQHPMFKRIDLIEGDSAAALTFERVRTLIPAGNKVLVCLDSNHYRDHVLKELRLYSPLVASGSYIVVFDTNTSALVNGGGCDDSYTKNGPLEAIQDFLQETQDFVIDADYNKLFISASPDGYLRRVK